jgi:hypothetical protein
MKRKMEVEGCSDSQADYVSHARYIELRKAPLKDQDEETEKKKFKSNLIEVMDEIISNYPPTNKNGE